MLLSAYANPVAQATNSAGWVVIQGLRHTLPRAEFKDQQPALVILNVPMPYATGNNFPGGNFGIQVNGNLIASGGFTYNEQQPQSTGRVPNTVVATVKLGDNESVVEAVWSGVRGSTVRIDSYATLVAMY
jgi:hypothetical protein